MRIRSKTDLIGISFGAISIALVIFALVYLTRIQPLYKKVRFNTIYQERLEDLDQFWERWEEFEKFWEKWEEIEGEEVESFQYTDIEFLDIEGVMFDIHIEGYAGDTLDASVVMPNKGQGIRVMHEQWDNHLQVWVEGGLRFDPSKGKSPRMSFKVPENIEITIVNSSGDCSIEGITAEETRLRTSSGDMYIQNVTAHIRANSSSGNITLKSCAKEKELISSSGKILVLSSEGDIFAKSSSGDLEFEETRGTIKASSTSGDLRIDIHEGMLDITTTSGNQQANSVLLTGDSTFQTTSGDIAVDLKNNLDNFSFDLSSHSGTLQVGKTEAENKLVTGNGPITIRSRSVSGDQSYG